MIKVDTKERIRELYFREEYSIRAISRMLKVARKTVKRALADAEAILDAHVHSFLGFSLPIPPQFP
ncbi:MAG: hypothetical protein H5U03_09190 [Clostridia bacterium]|nr:hypothetical protein [Clostridia bacterium]